MGHLEVFSRGCNFVLNFFPGFLFCQVAPKLCLVSPEQVRFGGSRLDWARIGKTLQSDKCQQRWDAPESLGQEAPCALAVAVRAQSEAQRTLRAAADELKLRVQKSAFWALAPSARAKVGAAEGHSRLGTLIQNGQKQSLSPKSDQWRRN